MPMNFITNIEQFIIQKFQLKNRLRQLNDISSLKIIAIKDNIDYVENNK